MVGIVVVSHSDALAEGVVALAREMGGQELALEAAGGTDDPGVLGTDAERVRAAIERAMSADGVLVLMDLGSALMSAEFAVELLGILPGRVRAERRAARRGHGGGGCGGERWRVARRGGGRGAGGAGDEGSQLGVADDGAGAAARGRAAAAPAAPPADARGGRSRFATRSACTRARRRAFVETVRPVRRRRSRGQGSAAADPVRATSLTNVVALGARYGDSLSVTASGPQADEVLLALAQLADEGFGDGVAAQRAPAPARIRGRAARPRSRPRHRRSASSSSEAGWPASQDGENGPRRE